MSNTITEEEIKLTLRQDIEILVVEDERAHYLLADHCLKSAGVKSNIMWFEDGQAVMDFLNNGGSP